MSLPTYREYRDSGVEWLGEIPQHWDVCRLKTRMTLCTDKTARRCNAVALENIESWSGRFIATSSEFEGDGIAFQRGYLLFGKLRPYLAKVYLAESAGEAVGDFHVLRPADSLDGRYALYQMLNRSFIEVVDGSTFGSKMPRANWESLGGMPVAVPPRGEQMAIAAFLDRETAKIDALIVEQEKLIALLAEKRQATISLAVTRGLIPDVPRKDSSVAWLSHVPAHWILVPLARLAKDRCDGPFGSGIKSEHYRDGGALVIRLQNIRAGAFNKGESVYIDEGYFLTDLQGHSVVAGDLLIAGLGDENNLLGRACVAPTGLGPALVKADCFRFRLDEERAVPEFVAWQLSAGAAHDAGILATGTTRSRIPLGTMSSRKIALPPVEEQIAIAQFIAQENSRLDALKSESARAIDLLKERRSALIATAVTGQIDVRSEVPQPAIQRELVA